MDDLTRYHAMVSDMARQSLGHTRVAAADDQVMMAAPAAQLLLDDKPSLAPALVDGLKRLAQWGVPWASVGVTPGMTAVSTGAPARDGVRRPIMLRDSAGHARDVYHPLALHLHLAAFARRYETLPPAAWSACEDAVPEAVAPARVIEAWTDVAPPPNLTALVLWHSLCLVDEANLTRRDVDIEIVDAVVHHIAARAGRHGSLHPQLDDESPDAWTYRELCGLHALAAIALTRRNSAWARRVEEIAMYHLNHTQPDFVTYQPWGVFAFAWSEKTRGFADEQLRDVAAAAGSGAGGATSGGAGMAGLLLADAADALRGFVK